ncbi:MAG: hypothetical protein ABR545_05715 [Cyclonatronaceae bacterium]
MPGPAPPGHIFDFTALRFASFRCAQNDEGKDARSRAICVLPPGHFFDFTALHFATFRCAQNDDVGSSLPGLCAFFRRRRRRMNHTKTPVNTTSPTNGHTHSGKVVRMISRWSDTL